MEREQMLLSKARLVRLERLLELSCGPSQRGDDNSTLNLISKDKARETDSEVISTDVKKDPEDDSVWRVDGGTVPS